MAPTPDFCWEGRLAFTIFMLVVLYVLAGLRYKVIHHITFKAWSPRGVSSGAIAVAAALLTAYTAIVCWNYSVWYPLRALWEETTIQQNKQLLLELSGAIPNNRAKVAFAMRMILVTVLWCVKVSLISVFYEFIQQLPQCTKYMLNTVAVTLVGTYVVIWIVVGMWMKQMLQREEYTPAAGAFVVMFTPINGFSQYARSDDPNSSQIPSLLSGEIVISTLNAATDFLIMILVYILFRSLHLAGGQKHFRAASLLIGLCITTIVIAFVRIGVLVSCFRNINARLAFDVLTDFEAFTAACAACVPALRVLVRDRFGDRAVFGFAEGWGVNFGSFGSRGGRWSRRSRTKSSYLRSTTTQDTMFEHELQPSANLVAPWSMPWETADEGKGGQNTEFMALRNDATNMPAFSNVPSAYVRSS